MLFILSHTLPEKFFVAVSGGVDSMASLHWLNTESKRDKIQGVVHFNHKTTFSLRAQELVRKYCQAWDIPFILGILKEDVLKKGSIEHFFRTHRYTFFDSVEPTNIPIIVAHQLDDCLEEYIACTMVRGFMGTIPYQRGRVIRPFRLWKRQSILEYAKKEGIEYIDDPSNADEKFRRNFIRHSLVPRILTMNPGVYTLVKKAISMQDNRNKECN